MKRLGIFLVSIVVIVAIIAVGREAARQQKEKEARGLVDPATPYPEMEYSFWVDCNCNGHQDAFDIMDGRSRDENSDGIPDECQKRHASAETEVGTKGCLQDFSVSDPFGDSQTVVHVQVRGPLSLKVRLYDEAGRFVRSVFEGEGEVRRDIPLETKTLKTGYYFVRALETNGDSLQFRIFVQ
jgi:hypothetical protein